MKKPQVGACNSHAVIKIAKPRHLVGVTIFR